jgi:hypothetical protein
MAAKACAMAAPIPKAGPIDPIPITNPAANIDANATMLTLSIKTPPL